MLAPAGYDLVRSTHGSSSTVSVTNRRAPSCGRTGDAPCAERARYG